MENSIQIYSGADHDALSITKDISFLYKTNQENLFISAGHCSKDTEHLIATPHSHDQFELMIVLKGEVLHKLEQATMTYHQGHACLLNRKIIHHEILKENSEVVFINLSVAYVKEMLHCLNIQNPIAAFFKLQMQIEKDKMCLEMIPTLSSLKDEHYQQILPVLRQIREELEQKKAGFHFIILGLLERLFTFFANPQDYYLNSISYDLSHEDLLYAKIMNYIKASHGTLSRRELSEIFHYHPDYLNQIIKKHAHQSILQLSKTYQMTYAKEQLIHTQRSIENIILSLGYQNTSHFSLDFKKETGMTMLAYRKKYQKNKNLF